MRKCQRFLSGLIVVWATAVFAQDEVKELDPELQKAAAEFLAGATAGPLPKESIDSMFRKVVVKHGNAELFVNWLAEQRAKNSDANAQRLAELEVHISARRGDLRRASAVMEDLLAMSDVAKRRLDLRLWQARLYDALGEVDFAKVAYDALLKSDLPEADQQLIRLRIALTGLITGTRGTSSKDNAKALIELAGSSKDPSFRNRAAIVLAVQNLYSEAVKLFVITREGTQRFRSASRLAEWAIRANDRKKAIDAAWTALRSAQLRRDRRYSLALLVESYRLKEKKKGLEALVKEFAKENKEEKPYLKEMRQVWVELLRELGKHDEAIALFEKGAKDSGFSVEMRRELLEMQGTAGKVDEMIKSYRDLIKSEPNQLAWRGGLTRVLLEQAKADEAKKLWVEFVAKMDSGQQLIQSANILGELGMDALAIRCIERAVKLKKQHGVALLFLSDLYQSRGLLSEAEETLNRLNVMQDVDDAVRMELAGAFERVGRQDKAIEVMEAIRSSRETVAEDLEMRLAWLYSEVGNEAKAQEQWLALWRKVTSVPRRRYVEDRLMTVASRLGTLADIAIGLEEKLADGKADDREAGLLVRIYSRVNDSIAASEILEEYMTQTGKNEVERLQEKGRIYRVCNDYWNYEKVVERLIEVDPPGRTDYLRQLALSMLERGKAQDARRVLMQLRGSEDGGDNIGGEFEAGVLSLVGLHSEAADAYRKGIATYPDRIEAYLLLANSLKATGETDRAVGMFQFLAETAERDDLFTIAIDGLLNMEARGRIMQWARRITLERLAAREDKNYLYQLLSDLSQEVNDKNGQIRALENSLAVSGNRRLSILRECMDLSSRIRGGVFYSPGYQGPTNAGNKPFFAFGRRLIGLGEQMPPQVFLDLGQAFLADGDVVSAERTFAMARNLADERGYQQQVAEIFEKATKRKQALVRYDRLLRTSASNVKLISRVAKLNEQQGKDDVAYRFYRRGYDLLLDQTPLTTDEEKKDPGQDGPIYFYSGNRDAYQTYSDRLVQGVLVTVPSNQIEGLLSEQLAQLQQDITDLNKDGRSADKLVDSPRVDRRSGALRRMYFAFQKIDLADKLDLLLVKTFSKDDTLLTKFVRERVKRGWYDSVPNLVKQAKPNEKTAKRIAQLLGDVDLADPSTKLDPKDMWRRILPVWIDGDKEAARKLLRRVDQKKGQNVQGGIPVSYIVVNGVLVRQTTSVAADISAWTRLALELGDSGLALQFARASLRQPSRYGTNMMKQQFDAYRKILPTDAFKDLVRFAANLFKEDEARLVDYMWVVSNMGEEIGDVVPSDEEMLKLVEEGDLKLTYQFPFAQAMETFPKSIRDQAMGHVIERVDKKMRPRELSGIPFYHPEPLGKEITESLVSAIREGMQAAMQDNYLRYSIYYMPRQGKAVQHKENIPAALEILELLSSKAVRGKEPTVADTALMLKAIVLHQAGKTEEALKIVLENYNPEARSTDYYQQNMTTWAHRELIPVATGRFLKVLEEKYGKKKSTERTDRRLNFLRQAKNDQLLREAYEQAWKDHPEQSRYVTMYERWEQSGGRIMNTIKINERLLKQLKEEHAKKADAQTKSRITALERKLSSLWYSVGNKAKGFAYWKIADDADIARFEKQKVARASGKATATPGRPTGPRGTPGRPGFPAATMAASRVLPTGAVVSRSRSSNTPSSLLMKVKQAMDKGKKDDAARALRDVWRAYPPVVESPYRYRTVQKPLNNLRWPTSSPRPTAGRPGGPGGRPTVPGVASRPSGAKPSATKPPAASGSGKGTKSTKPMPPTPEQLAAQKKAAEKARREAEKQRRKALRGGLATLTPRKRTVPKRPTYNAWKTLAKEDFAIDEMNRLVRSRTPTELQSINDVLIGLLQAKRSRSGDDEVFTKLVGHVADGRMGLQERAALFTMLEEKPERLKGHEKVVDELLRRIDLSELKDVSRLAWICGKVGQKDRAMALYTHCALLSPSQGVTFPSLIAKVKELYKGDELMAVAERMFDVVSKNSANVALMLDLRAAHLSPEENFKRSKDLFVEAEDTSMIEVQQGVRAATLLAQAGEYDRAAKSLATAIQNSLSTTMQNYNPFGYRQIRPTGRLTRSSVLEMFPEKAKQFKDYPAWLRAAGAKTSEMVKAKGTNWELALETLLIIAYRQVQSDKKTDAAKTLEVVDAKVMKDAQRLQTLAIDVLREAELFDKAFALGKSLHDNNRLATVRFGDLVSDAAKAKGNKFATDLVKTLLEQSLDDELLASAEVVVKDDAAQLANVKKARQANEQADKDRESRNEAAKVRAAKRREWARPKPKSPSKGKDAKAKDANPKADKAKPKTAKVEPKTKDSKTKAKTNDTKSKPNASKAGDAKSNDVKPKNSKAKPKTKDTKSQPKAKTNKKEPKPKAKKN